MESRKSARLVNTDTDFSLLADFNIVEQRRLAQSAKETTSVTSMMMEAGGEATEAPLLSSRRRLHSMSDFHDRKRQKNIDQERREAKRRQRSERQMSRGSGSIEVPGSGVSILGSGSRKRRTSESRGELDSGYGSSFGSGFFKTNEENVKECTAAMVLMNLSVSPRDRADRWFEPPLDAYSDLSSPPPGTPRPSPAPSLSQIYLSEDEEPYKRPRPGQVVQYQCTWRGCNTVEDSQEAIEKHVRGHLGLPDPAPGTDYCGEEDFYYTEVEEELGTMELEQASDSGCSSASNDGMSSLFKPSLSPGITSLRENKTGFVRILPSTIGSSPAASPSLASSVPANFGSCHPLGDHIGMARPSSEAPASTTIYLVTPTKPASNDQVYNSHSWQGKKLVSIVPRPETSPNSKSEAESASPFVFKSNGSSSIAKSDKKCRKVYGIDQKDLWCTQCKWKKACGRFS